MPSVVRACCATVTLTIADHADTVPGTCAPPPPSQTAVALYTFVVMSLRLASQL